MIRSSRNGLALKGLGMFFTVALLFAEGALAGDGLSINCTNCPFATGQYFVGRGKAPGHEFGVVYCKECKTFEGVDLAAKEGRAGNPLVCPKCKQNRQVVDWQRDWKKPESGTQKPYRLDSIACPKCGKQSLMIQDTGLCWD